MDTCGTSLSSTSPPPHCPIPGYNNALAKIKMPGAQTSWWSCSWVSGQLGSVLSCTCDLWAAACKSIGARAYRLNTGNSSEPFWEQPRQSLAIKAGVEGLINVLLKNTHEVLEKEWSGLSIWEHCSGVEGSIPWGDTPAWFKTSPVFPLKHNAKLDE